MTERKLFHWGYDPYTYHHENGRTIILDEQLNRQFALAIEIDDTVTIKAIFSLWWQTKRKQFALGEQYGMEKNQLAMREIMGIEE